MSIQALSPVAPCCNRGQGGCSPEPEVEHKLVSARRLGATEMTDPC